MTCYDSEKLKSVVNPSTNQPTEFDDLWILIMNYERAKIPEFCVFGFISPFTTILKAYEG